MEIALKIRTTVQAGGRIEVVAPELPAGEPVEVTVRTEAGAHKRSAIEILAEAPGHRLFKTADKVDTYIRQERDSWDH